MGSSWGPRRRASALRSVLRSALDRALIGHARAKLGILVGGVAGVPVWIEGPPGSGRSTLARAATTLFGGRRAAVLGEERHGEPGRLAGMRVVRAPAGAGERVHAEPIRTSLLTAEPAVIDDVDRLPAAIVAACAREMARRPRGLVIAIAQAGAKAAVPRELDALRGQFALRVVLHGHAARGTRGARRLIDRVGVERDDPIPEILRAQARAAELRQRARSLWIPDDLRDVLAATAPGGDAAWLRDAPAVLRAHALLRGARQVEARDLVALRFLELPSGRSDAHPGQPQASEEREEPGERLEGEPALPVQAGPREAGLRIGAAAAPVLQPAPVRVRDVPLGEMHAGLAAHADAGGAVDALLIALRSHWGRGAGRRVPDPGGAPRRVGPMRALDELPDADPVELWEWATGRRGELPRVARRERPSRPRGLVILRDVSASMQGPTGRWCARLATSLLDLAERRRMPVGYVEFHHEAERYVWQGQFLHRGYAELRARVARLRAEGETSYQAPLRALLDAVPEGRGGQAVLVTDGLPVLGDPWVRRESAEVRQRGWSVHAVFVGLGEPPTVLRELSRATGGLCARVRPRPAGAFELVEVAA